MIKVDISNVWGQVSLPKLLAMEKEVFDAHNTLMEGTGEGSRHLGWLRLPVRQATKEIVRIQEAAKRIRETSDVFVVVGIGGSYLGARAAVEMLSPTFSSALSKEKSNAPLVVFAGNSISSTYLADLLELIYAAAVARGYSIEELEATRTDKAQKRGSFDKRIFLIETIENN